MSDRLQQRDWLVRVGGAGGLIETSELDVEFDIYKSLRHEPNTCSLKIYNLSPDNRELLESLNIYDPKKAKGTRAKGNQAKGGRKPKTGNVRVEIEAGYKSTGRSLIFRGDLRRALTKVDGHTCCTEIEGEDGGMTVLASRMNESFPAGTPVLTVVRACADAMGIGMGNVLDVSAQLSGVFSHGTSIVGAAADNLAGLVRRKGVGYSIQNGVIAWRRVEPLIARGYLLNKNTGLVGRPEKDSSGAVIATCLMVPDLSAGAHVQLESKDHNGAYQVRSVKHQGDSSGNQWYHVLELVAV